MDWNVRRAPPHPQPPSCSLPSTSAHGRTKTEKHHLREDSGLLTKRIEYRGGFHARFETWQQGAESAR